MRGQHNSDKKIRRLLATGQIPHHRRGYHREIKARHQPGCAIFKDRRCQCDAEIVVVWHEIPKDTFRSEERREGGTRHPDAPRPAPQPIPANIWRDLVALVHPDKWQQAGRSMQDASHEAMVWLNTQKPR